MNEGQKIPEEAQDVQPGNTQHSTPSTSFHQSLVDSLLSEDDNIMTESLERTETDSMIDMTESALDDDIFDDASPSNFYASRRRSLSDSNLQGLTVNYYDSNLQGDEEERDTFDISMKSDTVVHGYSRPTLNRSHDTFKRNLKRRDDKLTYDIRRKSDFGLYMQKDMKRDSFARKLLRASTCDSSTRSGMVSSRDLSSAPQDAEDISLIAKHLRCNFLFLSLDDEAIIKVAQQFEVCEYQPSVAIVQQGTVDESTRLSALNRSFFYILVDGECLVIKDGKQIHGKYGTIEKGTCFGEDALLFDENVQTESVIASKPSQDTGTIVVYRLAGSIFDEWIGPDEKKKLQTQIKDIQLVVNVLSGVDTKIDKGTIIKPYEPDGLWLWKQWSGTVMQYVWPKVIRMMIVTALFGLCIGLITGDFSPDTEHDTIYHLLMIGGWWTKLSPLTTFVSTFFLNEGFKFWKRFYWSTRGIQGRFNDISLILASNVSRRGSDGKFTDEASKALDDIARLQSLLHKLYWCSLVKRYKILLTPVGISYLHSKKLISHSEFSSLIEVGDSGHGLSHACMTWLVTRIELSVEREEIKLSPGATTVLYDKITNLRMLMARLPDMYDGRMPLAYVHFVHLSVSVLVWLSPIALFPLYWFWSIVAVGILTLFYQGIFTLTLMFLDPVDNDKLHEKGTIQTVGFDVGVLIRESDNGAIRYKGCAVALPQY